MILTITMNPSVDISYPLNHLILDDVNRVDSVIKTPGGKGLNVSRVLKNLQADLLAGGIVGGHLGEFITEGLENLNIKTVFYKNDQESRNCIAILHDGQQTEILESGPLLKAEIGESFKTEFKKILKENEISAITMSGSLPKGLPEDYYNCLIELANEENIPVLLDTSGKSLMHAVCDGNSAPYMIKPNQTEILDLLRKDGQSLKTNDLKTALTAPRFDDIEWIVVSMGAEGCIAKHQDTFYKVSIPEVTVKNPVGSGDATIAGFAKALVDGDTCEEILKKAMTCGVLNAMESVTGHIDLDKYDAIYKKISIQEL